MTSESQSDVSGLRSLLDSDSLHEWIARQRWYASKSHGLSGIDVVEQVTLGDELHLLLIQTRQTTGAHEVYQLLLLLQGEDESGGETDDVIAHLPGIIAYAALSAPAGALALMAKILDDEDIQTADGCFAFRHVEGAHRPAAGAVVRAMGAQQSNSSIVIDEQVVLKLFRKVESGINPELEMVRFLTARGFAHIAPLVGWYEYEGSSLASTLGIAQVLIEGGRDGWDLAMEEISAAPERLLERLQGLGRVTAQMHTTLASDPTDPAFSPVDPISESMSLLTASIDEEIERIFMRLPDLEALTPIYGRGDDVRARLATRSQIAAGGKNIRVHGDYHLGQTLHTEGGWVILDFEGEPGRSLPERRQKRSPLRDVAGMLRSLAYLASAAQLQNGQTVPEGFEQSARVAFLDGYLGEVDQSLLPGGQAAITNLISIFELEKAVYELRYELNNRPDWLAIPVAGIERLMDEA